MLRNSSVGTRIHFRSTRCRTAIRHPAAMLCPMIWVLGSAVACSSAIAPPMKVALEFSARRASSSDTPTLPPVTAKGGVGTVYVTGGFAAPTPCDSLSATASLADGTLTLAVRTTPPPPGRGCPGAVQNYIYTAAARDIPSGAVRVRVAHAMGRDPLAPLVQVVLDAVVTVN